MTRLTLLAICGVLLATFFSTQIKGDFADGMTCKQAVSELTKRQLKRVSECTGKLKFKTGKEKSEKKACVMKCVLMLEGTLDEEGLPDPIGVMVLVERSFPFESTPWVREIIMGCFETTSKLDPTEPNCKSYDPMVKCAMDGLNKFCNPPPDYQ